MNLRHSIRRTGISIFVTLSMLSVNQSVWAEEAKHVEIVYLNHAPVVRIIDDLNRILSGFPNAKVDSYTFSDRAGQALAAEYGFDQHLPILIVINGDYKHVVGSNTVEFYNFPEGNSFIPSFSGNWTYEDFETVLSESPGQ